MKKKLTALLLALTMALTMLTGCSGSTAEETDPVLSSLDAEAVDDVVDYLTDSALNSTDAALTVDGEEVPASFYLYWVAYQMSSLAQSGITADQLDTEISDGQTAADFLKENSKTYAAYYYSMANAAADAGLTLDEDEQAQADAYVEGLDAASLLYYSTTADAQRIVYEQYLLGQKLQESLYGEEGENAPSDDDLAAYAEQSYYTCRYILFPLTDGEGNELDSQAQKEQCQKVYEELKAVDAADLEDTFQTYQEKYNTTENGTDGNTDRFTSSTSSVVSGFADTVTSLENNELGMTQEATSYGYFVILRLPLELDESIESTLTDSYAADRFDSDIQDRLKQAEIAWTDAAEELDIQAFCTRLTALQQDISQAQAAVQQADSSTTDER